MSVEAHSGKPFDTAEILEQVSDAVAVVDQAWRCLYFNSAFEQLVGKNRKEMLGQTCWELAPLAVGTIFEQKLRQAMLEQIPVSFTAFYGRLDVLVEVRAFPTEKTLTVFFRDITEQEQIQQTLRSNEELFRKVFDDGPLGMQMMGLDHRYLRVNVIFCQMLGYRAEELLGKTFEEITHPDDLWQDLEVIDDLLGGRIRRHRVEKRYIRKDGQILWAVRTVALIRDLEGKPQCLLGMTEDISERRKVELALKNSEGTHRAMFEFASIGMTQSELNTGRFLRVNDTFCKITGYSRSELLELRFHDLDHPEERSRSLATFQQLVDNQKDSYEIIKRYRRKDGATIWVHVNVTMVRDAEGKPYCYLGVAQDITSQREWESKLQQAKEQAEAANSAKDQFLAVLSHELRTPLTPILGMAQLLEQEPGFSEEQKKSLALIRRNVELEARLIDDLLDLTRINRGKLMLQFGPVDFHQKIAQVAEMVETELTSKKLNFTLHLQAQKYQLQGDGARLQQVLWNLLKNAIKFTSSGGTITIQTHNPNDDTLLMEMIDTGVGISPETLPRIFNAFEQGGGDVTRKFGGLGLGLAISKGLVNMHGGSLHAHSAGVNRGATFKLELPVQMGNAVPKQPAVPVQISLTRLPGGKVLLVEDHVDTARVMCKLLQGYGFEVTLADSVASALRTAESKQFDLLISDIGLPDGSGLEIMSTLAAKYAVKGIAISGYGMEEDLRRSQEAGFMKHLTKPVDVAALEQVLRQFAQEQAG